jgi:TatD DNase family protein
MNKAQLIDTHCHLYSEEFLEDRREMIQRAVNAGVDRFFMPNIDKNSIDGMLELEEEFPGRCYPMMGLHPCYVKEDADDQLEIVRDWLAVRHFAAVGEIGLDFYWDLTFKEKQFEVFRKQLEWSTVYRLPVVIHSRNSLRECIDVVKEFNGYIQGIFHCFGGSREEAEEIMDLGMYLGIGGVVTFRKAGLDEVIRQVGLSKVVLETDAPYLAPVPFRGKRNESSYLKFVADKLAEVANMDVEEVARITTQNAANVFMRN